MKMRIREDERFPEYALQDEWGKHDLVVNITPALLARYGAAQAEFEAVQEILGRRMEKATPATKEKRSK